MANYVLRVQLHNEDNYAEFHRAMERRGFKRTIDSFDGVKYHLPNGSYSYVGTKSSEDLLASASDAATEVRSPAEVIVTKGDSTWQNLRSA